MDNIKFIGAQVYAIGVTDIVESIKELCYNQQDPKNPHVLRTNITFRRNSNPEIITIIPEPSLRKWVRDDYWKKNIKLTSVVQIGSTSTSKVYVKINLGNREGQPMEEIYLIGVIQNQEIDKFKQFVIDAQHQK